MCCWPLASLCPVLGFRVEAFGIGVAPKPFSLSQETKSPLPALNLSSRLPEPQSLNLNPKPQEKKKNLVKDKIVFLERLLRTKPRP